MTTTDRSRLGSRLQMARGWYWAFGVNGDPYAMLLCGQDDTPHHWYEQIRSASDGLFRSRSGAWVVTRYDTAAQVLRGPGFTRAAGEAAADWARPFLDVRSAAGLPLTAVDELALEYREVLARTGARFDLMRDLARETPVHGVTARLGLTGEDARRVAALLRSSATALDARLTPQPLAVTERTVAALADLRQQAGPEAVLAGAGCEAAANTVGNAVLATLRTPGLAGRLAEDPDLADRIVAETLRTAPPVHLEVRHATAGQTLEGTRIAEGDEVVVAVAAAHRDPRVFAEPDRFDPDRFDVDRALTPPPVTSNTDHPDGLEDFAARHAAAALRALADVLPGTALTGPVVHLRRSPVLRGISRCPVEIKDF
ncbi:cytochrome P450 [Streptomyces sp. NPDC047525]|uniref:cytochrome P450 family protein n=1 Tax=Streptomyces sp. NPDC047525 TaxID=3155264 RepID=UPI0033E4B42F